MKKLFRISGLILIILSFFYSCKKEKPTVPTLTSMPVSAISYTTATSGGNITADNGGSVTARGVCWGTSTSPTTANSITNDGKGTGSFVSYITGLQPGKTYYLSSYAINSAGTAYGNELTFTTLVAVPTLTTETISSITQTSATCGGNISNDGGAPVIARGVCWSTSQNPTTANSNSSDGSGTGSFTSNLTNLNAGTTYYVRAYATNSAGPGYGNQVSFATDQYPRIRLKTGTLLNNGARIYFLALSKTVNYFSLTSAELFAYKKTDADWYIDGDVVPFTTSYKEFTRPVGTHYLLLSAGGLVAVTTITVSTGDQTVVVSGTTYGGISITVVRPKKSGELEQLNPELIEYFIPGQTDCIIKR